MHEFIAVLVDSLLAAGLYATMSYGLAVIYGVMRIINLAHAGILMLGAYATWTLYSWIHLDPFLSLVVVIPLFFGLGVVLFTGMVKRLPLSSSGPSIESLLLLFGVWLVLQNLAYAIWSGDTQSILTGYTMKSVSLAGVRVGVPTLAVFAVSGASLLVLEVVLRGTFVGRAIRAVDPESRRGANRRRQRRPDLRRGVWHRHGVRRRQRAACSRRCSRSLRISAAASC